MDLNQLLVTVGTVLTSLAAGYYAYRQSIKAGDANLKVEMEKLRQKNSELEQARNDAETRVARELRDELRLENKELKATHDQEIQRLETRHSVEISRLEERFNKRIEEMETRYKVVEKQRDDAAHEAALRLSEFSSVMVELRETKDELRHTKTELAQAKVTIEQNSTLIGTLRDELAGYKGRVNDKIINGGGV